jgi:hypothetical protein
LKKNVKPLTNAMDRLLKLNGHFFEWIDPAEHDDHVGVQEGVIAQEVEEFFPQWVHETPDTHAKTVDSDQRTVLALVVESFREMKAENDSLKKELRAVKADTSDRLDRIEGLTDLPRAGFGYGYGGWGAAGVLGVALCAVLADRKRNAGRG